MDTNYAYNVGRFLLFYFQLEGEIQIFGFRQRLLKLTASLFLPTYMSDSKKKIRACIFIQTSSNSMIYKNEIPNYDSLHFFKITSNIMTLLRI